MRWLVDSFKIEGLISEDALRKFLKIDITLDQNKLEPLELKAKMDYFIRICDPLEADLLDLNKKWVIIFI